MALLIYFLLPYTKQQRMQLLIKIFFKDLVLYLPLQDIIHIPLFRKFSIAYSMVH
jgi:hypothetical protein